MSEEIVSSPVCGAWLDSFVHYSVGPTSINTLLFGSVIFLGGSDAPLFIYWSLHGNGWFRYNECDHKRL